MALGNRIWKIEFWEMASGS